MRERHESEDDRQRESQLALVIESLLSNPENPVVKEWPFLSGVKLKKMAGALEGSYRVDWCITQEKHDRTEFNGDPLVVGWAELKCRSHKASEYKSLLLSAQKWMNARMLARETGQPFILFVEFSDAILIHVDAGENHPMAWGGRTKKTRDSGDIEPVVHIHMRKFRRLVQEAI